MKNNKALSKYKVSSIASSYCSSLHLRIITHALTQRRCFSSLFNLMMTSGSNMVTYFYLFFFRAKNVGCEVRRCVRQLNFFFFPEKMQQLLSCVLHFKMKMHVLTHVPSSLLLHICQYIHLMTAAKASFK